MIGTNYGYGGGSGIGGIIGAGLLALTGYGTLKNWIANKGPQDAQHLGPKAWALLHSIAAAYPDYPTLQQKMQTEQFLRSFAQVYLIRRSDSCILWLTIIKIPMSNMCSRVSIHLAKLPTKS
jgi:hypothetical protein